MDREYVERQIAEFVVQQDVEHQIAEFVAQQLDLKCHSLHLFHCGRPSECEDDDPADPVVRESIFKWVSPGMFDGSVMAVDIAAEVARKSSIYAESHDGGPHKFGLRTSTERAGAGAMSFDWIWQSEQSVGDVVRFVTRQLDLCHERRSCGQESLRLCLHRIGDVAQGRALTIIPDQIMTAVGITCKFFEGVTQAIFAGGGDRRKFEVWSETTAGLLVEHMTFDWPPLSIDASETASAHTLDEARDDDGGPSRVFRSSKHATPGDPSVVHVFAADEDPAPEVSIVVSGKFPRAPSGDQAWPQKHMERFRADARALEAALVATLPGGTLHQLTSLLLSRRASQLVVRDFSVPPEPAPAAPPESTPAPTPVMPVPMLLHCPECSARHLDEGEFATKVHHTHSCQSCGMTWRPAVVPTVGVRFLPGFKNEASSSDARSTAAPGPATRGYPPRDEDGLVRCPKCGAGSGDDWRQCNGVCPMPCSPHYRACRGDEPGDGAAGRKSEP